MMPLSDNILKHRSFLKQNFMVKGIELNIIYSKSNAASILGYASFLGHLQTVLVLLEFEFLQLVD